MRLYENPEKTSENRLSPRSYYIPGGCSEYTLLNGQWRFAYYKRDIDVPEVIEQWDTIPVPSCWQILGYENPNYTNINYPYPVDLPYVPDDNPCGVYERDFNMEKIWGRVYFVLEGVSSCGFVYVNGKYVGFTQGSHLQAEFDVTNFVQEGKNTLRVKVLKWCCGSYLEDQDFFRMNGIFRDCYLLQRPEGHIKDVQIIPNDKCIDIVVDGVADVKIFEGDTLLYEGTFEKTFSYAPEHPILWNAEKPFLYTVEVSRLGEVISLKAGMRSIAISDAYELLINGVSVKLHGVNHHDTSKYRGWCLSDEELRKDLLCMKQLNMNCIRTSHYPPTPKFVALCDEFGFYVILETDMETHGFTNRYANVACGYDIDSGEWTGTKKEWKKEHVERMARAVECYKNFASVIMWSTGNESGHGTNHVKMIQWAKKRDSSRLIHCEDASRKGEMRNADVYSRMYPSVGDLKWLAENDNFDMPVFLCEYAHAMGNGPGDVYYYNEMFDRYPKLIGGCIWEWADHVVTIDEVQKYGGDFEGELTHDGNFCCDGLVFSDRSFKAGSLEAKKAYQPIRSKYEDGKLSIYNRLDFTNLKEYKLYLNIEVDGEIVWENVMTIDVLPHSWIELSIPYEATDAKLGAYLNCYLKKNDWCCAVEQHELPILKEEVQLEQMPAQFETQGRFIIAKGHGFTYTFDTHYGTLTSMVVNGKEQLAGNVKLTAFRAPTDNDRDIKKFWCNGTWEGENLNCSFTKVYNCSLEGNTIVANCSLAGVSRCPAFRYTVKYAVFADGRIDVSLDGTVRENVFWLPRLGFELELPKEHKSFSYYGKGPMENYCDMHNCATVGMYHSTTEAEYVPYVRPQEHGNHTKVKQLTIGDLSFVGKDTFEFCASDYSTKALYQAEHTDELKTDGNVHLRIDYMVSGLGSNSCGPALEPEYRLSQKEIVFEFGIKPVL